MGWAIAALITGFVSAAATATGAIMQGQSEQASYNAQARFNKAKADAERQAGETEASLIEYQAQRKQRSFLSRIADAGVQVGEGSVLEGEKQFAADVSIDKQKAQYNHGLVAWQKSYEADFDKFLGNRAVSAGYRNAAIGGGTSLATSFGSYALRRMPPASSTPSAP